MMKVAACKAIDIARPLHFLVLHGPTIDSGYPSQAMNRYQVPVTSTTSDISMVRMLVV